MPKRSFLRRLARLLPLGMALLLAGCSVGYQQIEGEWNYVTLDSGRVENPIPRADTATFKPFRNSEFARDKNLVYFRGLPLEGADAGTFRPLRSPYWTDANRVYYFDKPVPGADPRTFRFLKKSYWTRDDGNVYYGADPVNPKDLASFELVNASWARDELWYYPAQYDSHNPIETLERGTFEILKGGWARDCCRVFYFDRVVDGADPATFEAISDVRGRDQSYYYLTGFRQRTVAQEEALQQRNKGQ
jgi:hypothetical protein